MFSLLFFILIFRFISTEPLQRIEVPRVVVTALEEEAPQIVESIYTTDATKNMDSVVSANQSRRIMRGREVGNTRPYMVYLRAASSLEGDMDPNWTCGGVIIDERYILTSAACIEDVHHFYVISGSRTWNERTSESECVKNGAKKAIWKCVPKSYVYDGHDFDNIKWMINDIAVVKVEDDFNFHRRIRGCDFIPQKIAYNNQSVDHEKPGTLSSIAGWGSVDAFSDIISSKPNLRISNTNEELLETEVVILSKKNCKKRWPERYHHIIDEHMICGKDDLDTDTMSKTCTENEVACKELVYSDEDEDLRRRIPNPEDSIPLSGKSKRRAKPISGGFCENDHGGPLVVGHGKTSMVIGVMSASMTRERTRQCYGPFLYTSVWNNRHLISCAIFKEMGSTCRQLLRSSRTSMFQTSFNWKSHPDGPAKSEEVNDESKYVPLGAPKSHLTGNVEDVRDDYFNSTTTNGVNITTPPPVKKEIILLG